MSPPVFPLACPDSRFAPVYVGDVVAAFVHALQHDATVGQRLELCGPEEYTLRQLVEYTRDTLGLCRRIVGLDYLANKLVADDHWHGNGLLCPGVPVPDVNIGAADGGAVNLDEDVADSDARLWHILHPESGFRFRLD